MTFASVVIAAAGTPQSLAAAQSPLQPTVIVQGVTSSMGGSQQPAQVLIQADPSNTGNVYIGAKGMVKASRLGVGAILTPGAFMPALGASGAGIVLDELWGDADTTGNKILLSMLG